MRLIHALFILGTFFCTFLWAGAGDNKLPPKFNQAEECASIIDGSQKIDDSNYIEVVHSAPYVLQFDLSGLSSVQHTSIDAVNIMRDITRDTLHLRSHEASYKRFMKKFVRSMVNLGDGLWEEYLARLYYEPGYKEAYEHYLKSAMPQFYDFDSLYNQPDSSDRYKEFVSIIQKYFSTLLVGYSAVRSELPLNQNLSFLDLGTGIGDTIYALKRFFPKAQIVGFDKSKPLLERTKQLYPDVETVQGDFDLHPLPFAGDKFDMVTLLFSANQYQPIEKFLKTAAEVLRVLKPGGYALVEYGPWNQNSERSGSVYKFLKELAGIGFETEAYPVLRINTSNYKYYPILLRKPKEGAHE